jgi:membrane protein YdbS with pleckstrin-like domain
MENFSNETIETTELPKFETVIFSKLQSDYWKVVLINLLQLFVISGVGLIFAFYKIIKIADFKIQFVLGFLVLHLLIIMFARIGFNKKGFAFRNHDVLFKQGIIATTTMVIPYNRIQHVALEEGVVSRFFGLAKIEIFTAGGSNSDIQIPGIKKEEAENIKQLLMGKIQIQLQ